MRVGAREREPIARVWGRAQRGGVQMQSPWSGAKPPEAESLLAFGRSTEAVKFAVDLLTVSDNTAIVRMEDK